MTFFAWALNEYDERHEMVVVNYANRATIGPRVPAAILSFLARMPVRVNYAEHIF
jgi:hypothetical protein